MYEKLTGKNIKIVFLDGNQTIVHKCTVVEYDESITTLHVKVNNSELQLYVNAKQIIKIEVLDDE